MIRSRFALLLTALAVGACANAGGPDDAERGAGGAGGGDASGPGATSGSTSAASSTGTTASATSGASSSTGAASGSVTSASSSTGGPAGCAHDVCEEGLALSFGCGDPCVDIVCDLDDFCCTDSWDVYCVEEAVEFCGADCFGGGGGGPVGELGPGDLVITEVMNNPKVVTDAMGEWFEVYNASADDIDLLGLVIRHQDPAEDPNATHVIADSVIVPAGGYAVLGLNADTATNGAITLDYAYPGNVNLANTDDHLAIETAAALVIDVTTWDQASGLDPDGRSRNLSADAIDADLNDDDATFCAANTPIPMSTDYGTPGADNIVCN